MPQFIFDQQADGRLNAVYKDGVKITQAVHLEMPHAIVQTYFKAALRNLRVMRPELDREDLRFYGVQAFLMSLVGLEAFLNVHFHIVGIEKRLPKVIDLATKQNANVETKISHLSRQAYGATLVDQKMLNKKMRALYDLRSDIVHPKFQSSSLSMDGLVIEGMVDNYQQIFEDREFCLEALRWCLLVVARVGMLNSTETVDIFVKQWKTFADTNATLSRDLSVAEVE